MSSSPKKNSIFVELDKKIKDLEYNLSLSNDYLETLSSRYKKVGTLLLNIIEWVQLLTRRKRTGLYLKKSFVVCGWQGLKLCII